MIVAAGYLGLAAFLWLAVFQTLLALGLPFGHLAWGGRDVVLPPAKRIGSVVVIPLAIFGGWVMAQAIGVVAKTLTGATMVWVFWGFAALFALSLVGNIATESRPERLHGVPLTIALFSANLILALALR